MAWFRKWDESRVYRIPVGRIAANPFQPRKKIDAGGIETLAASIRQSGLLSPILVRPIDRGRRFELVAGQRRLLACRTLGWDAIPALVRELSGEQVIQVALLENLHRSNLSVVEQADAFRRLGNESSLLSVEEVAARVGLPVDEVASQMRLLGLPDLVREAVIAGVISGEHARELLAVKDCARQVDLVRQVHRERLSPAELRCRVEASGRPAAAQNPAGPAVSRSPSTPTIESLSRDGEALLEAVFAGDGNLQDDVDRFSDGLLARLRQDPIDALSWRPPERFEHNLAGHLVRTAAHAMFLASRLSMPAKDLRVLGAASLLCDIGMKGVPAVLLDKRDSLSVQERQVIQRHVGEGSERLGRAGIDARVIRIVVQHHERFDGTGYPEGARGRNIDPLALWVGLMDMYTALGEPRAYRGAATSRKAVQQILLSGHRGVFPKHLLRDFLHVFGLYPVGSQVQLKSGQVGWVVQANPEAVQSPVVRLSDGSLVDLATHDDEITAEKVES